MPIRQAQPDDFDAIQELNRQISENELENGSSTINVEYSYLPEGVKYLKNIVNGAKGNYGFVFEQGDEVLGYASLRIIDDENITYRKGIKQIQLKNLCVDKNYSGNNIGHQLIEASKSWAKEQGANNLKVLAMAKNTNARRFYQDCGFEEYEIIHEIAL